MILSSKKKILIGYIVAAQTICCVYLRWHCGRMNDDAEQRTDHRRPVRCLLSKRQRVILC